MPYFIILIILLADRLSKLWAAAYFAANGPIQINAFFTLRQTYNEGVAFGMFQGIGPLIGWLTILVVIWLFVYLVRAPKPAWLMRYGLGILIGGALGNMVDRITTGQVLDFIESPLRSGIFNVADIAINSGMILVLVGSFIHRNVLDEKEETAVSENNEF